MIYAIKYIFKNNIDEKRAAKRESHLAHIKGAGKRLLAAGPLLKKDGSKEAYGSLLVIEAQSETAAELFSNTDPYVTAGIVKEVVIHPWNALFGSWVPKGS